MLSLKKSITIGDTALICCIPGNTKTRSASMNSTLSVKEQHKGLLYHYPVIMRPSHKLNIHCTKG